MEDIDLSPLGVRGFTRFSIKAVDNEVNASVHSAFKEFCRVECDNDYTLGLKLLLQAYQRDFKYEMLWDKIQALESQVLEVTKKPVVKTQEDNDDEQVSF